MDEYSGAAVGYSFRLLRSDYSGNCITVRRASDNATQNIGFVDDELDVASLETFCSGTDGFVTTWYDQSGNGNDATQTTASAQPKIVSSGSVILENGKPSIEFDGVNDGFAINDSTSYFNFLHNGGSSAVAIVCSLIENDKNLAIIANNGRTTSKTGYSLQFEDRNVTGDDKSLKSTATNSVPGQFVFFNQTANNIIDNDTQFVVIDLIDGDNSTEADRSELYIDGGTAIKNNIDSNTPAATNATDDMLIFNNLEGALQELLIFDGDQSSNRTGIQDNINDYYNIY